MKNIGKHIVLMLLLTGVNFVTVGQYKVSGVISNGHKLTEPATVILDGAGQIVETDSEGKFLFENVYQGNHSITIFLPGYKTDVREIDVTEDLHLDIKMSELEVRLDEVVVQDTRDNSFGITRLKSIDGAGIYEAKKTEVIVLEDMVANKAANNARQVFAKIPGANIWESDCAGLQIGVATRGLSPNRNSNFNTRQNGFDISADALGYPESYYTPPIQAVQKIELVRGAASLQYGTQFGGLVNFVIKKPPLNKAFEFSTQQTVNSLGFYNSYADLGGTNGKLSYFFFNRTAMGDCWRCNTDFTSVTSYMDIHYDFSESFKAGVEYTRMNYLAKQPGGLTDNQFYSDPKQSLRDRNWFQVNWNLITLHLDYIFTPNLRLNSRTFSLLGSKEALGNLGRIDRPDESATDTTSAAYRDLLSDQFKNWGNETRLIYNYYLGREQSAFLIGTRYYKGFTHRRQGDGPFGDDHTFKYNNPDRLEGSDFDLPGTNVSAFVENIFNVSPKFSITPGVRFEYIGTEADGYYRSSTEDLAGNTLTDTILYEDLSRTRSFIFGGLGLSYKPNPTIELYANYAQNYRSINFNDIRVNNPSLVVDENIQDEFGSNCDLGARGNIRNVLNFDVSLFVLQYNDRIGTILTTEPDPKTNYLTNRTVRFRTNVADAHTYGLETFAELNLFTIFKSTSSRTDHLSVFINLGLIQSEYKSSDENGIQGNQVELVPIYNLKSGLTYKNERLSTSFLVTSVAQQYSDATNAEGPVPGAVEGIIPAYTVLDFSAGYQVGRGFKVEAGVNNLLNSMYFTRRAAGYPGPGILPSDGRSVYVTLGWSVSKDR